MFCEGHNSDGTYNNNNTMYASPLRYPQLLFMCQFHGCSCWQPSFLFWSLAGSQCHTATLSNICSDIPLLTIIKIPTPDLRGTLEFRVGFRSSPPKVCFSGPKDECGSSFQPTSTPDGIIISDTPFCMVYIP